ncbi:MAG: response regulator [candidate division Zixibacteria bacterium]|nr:response regulator [candidate division Zixibacteria bacterium]MDH3936958.1 response regulator [candidate division Zixibacteria bacterium]MDH4034318.1 response regulator [candidate division Zixibacteria bacterium]
MNDARANILIVDDDTHLLDLLVDTLVGIGYQATGVPGGIQALEKLKAETFDLMISDIKMPGLDGLGLLKKVRRYYPRLPVLFITGFATAEMIGRASADGFLAKPFRISHIEELIEDTLSGKLEKIATPLKRILVVDDDDTFRETLTSMLRAHDYIPVSASSAADALKELDNGDVDAVISDIRMPDTDGITLMQKIKQKNPEMPVILITGFMSTLEPGADSLSSTPDGFLQKPFKVEKIIKLLNELSTATTGSTG